MPEPRPDHLCVARRVIGEEAEALGALGRVLGGAFDEAVEALFAARGRAIVSGMGKSGHVARKLAATLASTGTPAHFVHPAEASHGDLGMMAAGDVVICLSNSGETPELSDLVAHARRHRLPLIGVSCRADSALMRQADIPLLLPDRGEACGYGVVPTTSTTMMMALGDALAIALMVARRFTPENFRAIHPGGRLGARLTRVESLMHRGAAIPLVDGGTPMGEALVTMSQKGFGIVGVTGAEGYLEGVITDGDLRRHMAGLLERRAGEVMTPGPRTIAPGALAEEAVALMNESKITSLFVVDPDGPARVVGFLHIHDCLRVGAG